MEEKSFMHKISERFCEEIEDANTYLNLADEATAASMPWTSKALRMIAHEEMTHARYLRDRLEEVGALHAEKEEKWDCLLKRMGYK